MNLNNRIPLYRPPFDDELFTSWIVRNALYNEENTITFARGFFETSNFWDRDIDRYCPKIFLEKAAAKMPIRIQELEMLTLKKYSHVLFKSYKKERHSFPFVLSIGIYHRKRIRYGIVFCPKCLKKDSYFKIKDRLAFTIVCSKCESKMEECCLKCGSPIMFHRVTKRKVNLSLKQCPNCYHELFNVNTCRASQEEILTQYYLDVALEGEVIFGITSFDFFQILKILLNSVIRNFRSMSEYRQLFRHYYPKLGEPPNVNARTFELLELSTRRKMLVYAVSIIKNGFVNFALACKAFGVNYSNVIRENSNMVPLCFKNPFGTNLKKP